MRDFLNDKIIYEDLEAMEKALTDWHWIDGNTFFISGAYGMIVSYFVFFLIYLNEKYNASIKIIAQGRNEEKMKSRFGKYCERPYFSYCKENICKPIESKNEINYIIHAASLASPQFYQINPVDVLLPNTVGTINLMELAKKQNNFKGFLFFSSCDVYGIMPFEKEVYTESDFGYLDCMNVRSCYGESKRMGETICKSYFVQSGIPSFVVRIAHTYGPTMDIYNDQRVFAEFVKNIINNENIEMKSDGLSERMFCYAKDATVAFFLILQKGIAGEAYNMCNTSQRISIKTLAQMLAQLFPEKGIRVKYEKRSEESIYMESPVKRTPIMSTEKLETLGWRPVTSAEEGFKRTVISLEQQNNDG